MKAETKLRVAACAAGFALPRYNDLPSVGLYLDQTVQFVNGYFRSFCGVELTPLAPEIPTIRRISSPPSADYLSNKPNIDQYGTSISTVIT